MEPEMVSTSVDNAPAFLQLRDKYKQELVGPTLFSDQTEARRAEKKCFGGHPPPSQGLDDQPPPLPDLISKCGSGTEVTNKSSNI